MISSVTSATVTATSTVAGWGVVLGAAGAILVIGLLIAIELLGATHAPWQRSLQRVLRVSTSPLLFVFAISVSVKALAALASS
jgi:hypothetical protein